MRVLLTWSLETVLDDAGHRARVNGRPDAAPDGLVRVPVPRYRHTPRICAISHHLPVGPSDNGGVPHPHPHEPAFAEGLSFWDPQPKLVTSSTEVSSASQPVIDCHNHLGRWLTGGDEWMCASATAFLKAARAVGVQHIVNFDGLMGRDLEENLRRYDRVYPAFFSTFMQLDWSALTAKDPGEELAGQVRLAAQLGAVGIKIWKNVGLDLRRADGELLMPDDAILTPIWETAAELDLPVCIHVADPMAFFCLLYTSPSSRD